MCAMVTTNRSKERSRLKNPEADSYTSKDTACCMRHFKALKIFINELNE